MEGENEGSETMLQAVKPLAYRGLKPKECEMGILPKEEAQPRKSLPHSNTCRDPPLLF